MGGRVCNRLSNISATGRRALSAPMAFPVASTGAMQQEEATMAAYIVATVRISDPEKFALYGKAIAGLSERFGGVPVVKGPVAEVLEGGSPVGERVEIGRAHV